jgi:hypothetical protein
MLVSDYSFNGKLTDHIKPGLKLYADNFSAGTYFYDYSRISVFFQFKFPRFYIGSYIEIPKNTPLYKNHLLVELTAGINLSSFKSGILRNYHW